MFAYKSGNKLLPEKEIKVVREPVVAGSWYPGGREELKAAVGSYLGNVKKVELNGTIKAIIVPHAGYKFSGQVAAVAFKQLDDVYDTVFLMGPSHQFPLTGASISSATHYKTPLGETRLSDKVEELLEHDEINTVADAHSKEHSLEIELPFLQEVLSDFELIPVVVGNINPEVLEDALIEQVDDETLVVVSVDLSHYHAYDEAIKLDSYSLNRIMELDSEGIFNAEIDAPWAVSTLLNIARRKDWKPVFLFYANSGDVTGDKSGVVGYASIAFIEEETDDLSAEEKEFLLELARETAETFLKTGKMPEVDEAELSPKLKKVQGCFTTFSKNHNLRGCIGHILPQEELYKCVMDNAVNAAVNDRRFNPVVYDEMEDINVEVSVLSVPQRLYFSSGEELKSMLRPLVDGVVLRQGFKQSTYLPQVWGKFSGKEEFLSSLCRKGGMALDCWQDTNTEVSVYQALVFEEE